MLSHRRPTTTNDYSERRLVTGLATAARIAWKLIVISAINNAIAPAAINIHQFISILHS
jgi:hypothetical protein